MADQIQPSKADPEPVTLDADTEDQLETPVTKSTEPKKEKDTVEPDLATRGRDLANRALHFLSNASTETLGACGVALCASTYLVLGRVGLVLIGAVGGIILHATWDGSASAAEIEATKALAVKRRKEVGVEVAKRLLDWRENRVSEVIEVQNATTQELDFSSFKPETGAALQLLTDAVVRDYVKWWYGPILPDENAFPAACRKTLTSFIISFSNHVSRKRPADTFLEFLTNSSSIVIVFLNELSVALMNPQSTSLPPAEAVRKYLQDEPESNLANVLSLNHQKKKLELVADDILLNFLDSKAYACDPVKIFLREVLAGLILEMTIRSCSKPEWINGWIVYLLEEGEPEFMGAIDAGVESMKKGVAKPATEALRQVEAQSPKKDDKRFSRAEVEMQEAMAEAQRLNAMIAEEEAQRQKNKAESETGESISTATTDGMATPTSTDSDRNGAGEQSLSSSMVLDQSTSSLDGRPLTPPKSTSASEIIDITTPGTISPAKSNSFSPIPTDNLAQAVFTLYNASVSIFDDSAPDDKSTFRNKPTSNYLIQIEPSSSRFPGWMISRKYADFEGLHEVLRRISVVSGVSGFVEKHSTLPTWKGQSKSFLRMNLERYLQHALKFEPLAESEGMKRFLEKEAGIAAAPASKNPFGFNPLALENVGRGIVDVLGNAPKGLAGGGKAVLGSVQGVFTGAGAQKKSSHSSSRSIKSASVSSLPKSDLLNEPTSYERTLPTSLHSDPPKPPLPQRPESTNISSPDVKESPALSEPISSPMKLPPPPSSIDDDYGDSKPAPHHSPIVSPITDGEPTVVKIVEEPLKKESFETQNEIGLGVKGIAQEELKQEVKEKPKNERTKSTTNYAPLSEEETRVAVELFFAIINELYSLSSAWNIRLTLLAAAKTFLLRPGNPSLEAIRVLIQESVIDANFSSDAGVAAHILKLRENSLPTEEELKAWPPEASAEEKEKLRVKARKLLVERGMPPALTSVMGAAASGEALGRVFDCLQIEEVSRGFIFALLLQAVRSTTQ